MYGGPKTTLAVMYGKSDRSHALGPASRDIDYDGEQRAALWQMQTMLPRTSGLATSGSGSGKAAELLPSLNQITLSST